MFQYDLYRNTEIYMGDNTNPSRLLSEISKIDRQIERLQRKRRELLTADIPLQKELRKSALLPNETVNRKNKLKLEIMGRVRFALSRNPQGLTSVEIFKAIALGANNLGFDGLRSYLSRFKREGRLVHDPQHHLWKLPSDTSDSVENN